MELRYDGLSLLRTSNDKVLSAAAASSDPSLHFLLFVPKDDFRPMQIQDMDGESL